MFGSTIVDSSSPQTSTPSLRPGSHSTPKDSTSSFQPSILSHERATGGGITIFSDNNNNGTSAVNKLKSNNEKSSTMATLFGTVEETTSGVEESNHLPGDNRHHSSTWSSVAGLVGGYGSNHDSKLSVSSSSATSTPTTRTSRHATATSSSKQRVRDITAKVTMTPPGQRSNVSFPHTNMRNGQQTLSPSSSLSSLPTSSSFPQIEATSSDDVDDDDGEKENIFQGHPRQGGSSSSSSLLNAKKDKHSIVYFDVLCVFSSTLACGISSTHVVRPPILETTLTAYVENFRNFDSYNHVTMVNDHSNNNHKNKGNPSKSGARFLLDVEAVVRNSSFAVQDILRFLCLQPHQIVLCQRILNGESLLLNESVDIMDETHEDQEHGNSRRRHTINMNEYNSLIDACDCLHSLTHKQKGNREMISSSKAFITTRSVVTTRVGNPEAYIDTTASTILKSAFKWLKKKLHNHSNTYHGEMNDNERRSMVLLPSPLSYASRGALLSAWASHGQPNIASIKSSAAALAATYAKSHDGQVALYKHSGKMNIIITEIGELYTSVSLVMLEMPISQQVVLSLPSTHDNIETSVVDADEDNHGSITITILSTSGTMNYGIKDAETQLLRTWLAGCNDKELFNDAILAMNSYRYCPQPSEYVPSGEGGGIQCGNEWLSPIEDLERKAQERSLAAIEERMLSLRATGRATVEAHALRGNNNIGTHSFTYTTPSLQRKASSIQQQQESLKHNRRHANQRSFYEFLFSSFGLLCQYLPCSPENQKHIIFKPPRRDRSTSDTGTGTNIGSTSMNDSNNINYGAWHENGDPTVDIPKRLHFYGLGEVVRGCVQSCLSPSRIQHASKVGDVLPINTNNDDNDGNNQDGNAKDEDKVDEVIRKPYPPIVESLLWVEGGAGVYKHCLTSLVKKEVEAQMGFVEAFRREEESFERRKKIKLERREKALRQLEREKALAAATATGVASSGSNFTASPVQPTPLPRLPSITKPSISIVRRWGYALPTTTSYPLFRGGLTVGTRYGFAMDGDDVLTEAETDVTAQSRKKEVIREYEFEYSKDNLPTILLHHDDAWNGAVSLIKEAANMRVYDVSPITIGMIIVYVVGVGKKDNIEWVKDEILLVKGVYEYVHWLIEDEPVKEIMLSLESGASNTISINNLSTDTFMGEVPICPVRILQNKRGTLTTHHTQNNKYPSSVKGRYVCITVQKNSFDNVLPFECKYEHRPYIDNDYDMNRQKAPLSVNTEVVGMVELTLPSSLSSTSSFSPLQDIVTSPLPAPMSHLSPIKAKSTKKMIGTTRTHHEHASYNTNDDNNENDDDDDDDLLMSLVICELHNTDINTHIPVSVSTPPSLSPSPSPTYLQEQSRMTLLPSFKNCVLCICIDDGMLAMTHASSIQAMTKFLQRGETCNENVENESISSPMLQSFHNLAEKVYQALTPLSAFIMPSAKRDTDYNGSDIKRHQRYLDVPRASLVSEFDASKTPPPPPPSTPVRTPNYDKNATKKFSIVGRYLGQQFRQLHPSLRILFMLASLVAATIVAYMFSRSSSMKSSLDSSYRTKLSIKSTPVLVMPAHGDALPAHGKSNIIASHINDIDILSPLKPNTKVKRGTKSSKARNMVSTKGSRKSGSTVTSSGKKQRSLPKEKGNIHHANMWMKKKVNGVMDAIIEKLQSAKSNME